MSESVLTRLPRFDAGSSPEHSPALNVLISGRHDPPREKVQEAEPAGLQEPEADATEATPAVFDEQAVQRTFGMLDEAIQQIENVFPQKLEAHVRSLAKQLFPKLSEAFLAEELTRHLPDLVPNQVAKVEIQVRAEMAEKLALAIERIDVLAGRYTITPLEGSADTRIRVSWQTGGVDFDFDGLMQACLARIGSQQSV